MSKSKSKSHETKPAPLPVEASPAPQRKRNRVIRPQDQHWQDWQKRHRAPRAIDVLMKTRAKEAADRAKEKAAEETPLNFDADDLDVEKSFL